MAMQAVVISKNLFIHS